MFCYKCGNPVEQDALFCPFCGVALNTAPQTPSQAQPVAQPSQPLNQVNVNGAYPPPPPPPPCYGMPPETWVHVLLRNLFSSGLFTALCVITTILAAVRLDIITIIAVVFFWMLRSDAIKRKPPFEMASRLRSLKILTIVQYVISWISVGIIALYALVVFVVMFFALSAMPSYGDDYVVIVALVILGVFFAALVAFYALYTIFFWGSCRKCADSFVRSCEMGMPLFEKLGTVRKWFIAMGIMSVLGSFGSVSYLFIDGMPLAFGIVFMCVLFSCNIMFSVLYFLIAKLLGNFEASLNKPFTEMR